ncbi:MAG: hypothetical protein WCF33_08105 [Pseudonocardiaceae bacterium]
MNVIDVLSLVTRYHHTSTRRLHLIPSENSMSLAARVPFLTDVVHRYCFPSKGENTAWPGTDDAVSIEHAAISGLRALYGAKYVNVKPISGINCMAVAMSALTEPGSTVLSIAESDGGHGATRFLAERLGLTWIPLPHNRSQFRIDIDRLAAVAAPVSGPKLVYLDQFMCLFPHDLSAVRAATGSDTTIHYDGSHVMGLIAGGQFQDPLSEGADSLGGSTHKSFPGPHKGILLTNSEHIARKLDEHAGHWVSHHHPADVAALAIVVAELRDNAADYAVQTVHNAQRLGQSLANRGLRVCAAEQGFTRSHQLWVDVAPAMDPSAASRALLAAGIVVNAIDIPYLAAGTGLRLGVQEVTWLGMGVGEMDELAAVFERVLLRGQDPDLVAADVRRLHDRFARVDADQAIQTLLQTVQRLLTPVEFAEGKSSEEEC